MAGPDIHQLKKEKFPEAEFPIKPHSDFRLLISPTVHQGIQDHASNDTSVEICGVLVGEWQQDENGPFASVTQYIRCNQAASKFAEVTFTHESWSQINSEMDSKYSDLRIIGWYHSHPDFGIFLSDRDVFIQENFFSGPGQVAYVVDPVRKLEGVFEWRNGKPVLMSHYWVGEKVWSLEASQTPLTQTGSISQHSSPDPRAAATQQHEEHPLMRGSIQLMMGLCLFLIGYLLAGTKSRWEQEMIVTGVVEHYGTNKLIKPGFEDKLREVNQRLQEVNHLFGTLSTTMPEDATKEQIELENKKRTAISQTLTLCSQALSMIQTQYGLTDQERKALTKYIQRKQRELQNGSKTNSKSADASHEKQSEKQEDSEKKPNAKNKVSQESEILKSESQ
ncbi:Mov34/MPN/PAD-1 family protein [Gimesia fumaroli]|uniref:Mov34/MPN/PAD-1 family protein n=1 Tax=Gimesia fumaroli TaxID=2527976 RepID=A0A518I9L1_9PLAN|nr:Mov34/MPN/PAD-1 family protein [Gimesia fumaroli]QDV49796.1 Mov34/MPN/PAD-1 family protein [Gimesia fumaroli]